MSLALTRLPEQQCVGTLDNLKPGGDRTRFSFNPDRQVTSARFVGQDSVSAEVTSIHGPRRVFSAQVDQRYHFDGVGRMDVAAGWLGKQRNFTFDNLGRLAQTAHRPFTTCNAPTEDDGYFCQPIAADSTHTYSYDQVGNRTDLSAATARATGSCSSTAAASGTMSMET